MGKNFQIETKGFPDLPQMMLATIRALKQIGGSASLQELDEQVVEMENISEDEQAVMMPDGKYRKLNYCRSSAELSQVGRIPKRHSLPCLAARPRPSNSLDAGVQVSAS